MPSSRNALAHLALLVALPSMGCPGRIGGHSAVPPAAAVTISPASASLKVNGQQQFTSTVQNASSTAVTWKVDGVIGGNSTVGAISTSGLYTAPASVPSPENVTVTVVSQADPSRSASATITIRSAANTGTGRDYQICTDPQARAQYLTSPWTYHALASGSHSYTVAEYKALAGYGTTLPPLPSSIADQPSTTTAAWIFAPGATPSLAAYELPLSPVLFFFEGGSYGKIDFQVAPGDVFIGGSAQGYPEPTFTNGRLSSQNDTWDFVGGGSTLAAAAAVGSKSVTIAAPIGGYIQTLTFPDGTSYDIASQPGNSTSIPLASGLTAGESAGTAVWASQQKPLYRLTAAAPQGATTLKTGPGTVPLLAWEYLKVGAAGAALARVQVSAVSGSPATGYTVTLTQPLSAPAAASAPLYYAGPAGGVTVEYLDIGGGDGIETLWVQGASGWTIGHNDIHDNYAGGANYKTTNASGTAIIGADHSTIEYNCFQRLGEYALNGGGSGTQFNHNQVDQTPYQPDLSGNGQSGCGKWWGSINNDVIANAFTNEGYSICLWFDNGNTGMLVQGNYFYNIGSHAIMHETGFNSAFLGNDFEEVEAAIYLNDSGGWDIPGSRYNNQILIQGNTINNALTGVSIWGASARSCLNSGESLSGGDSSPYCAGGFPQMPPAQQYFSHYYNSITGALATVATSAACSPSSPCTTVTLSSPPALADWIGFADPAKTTTSASTNVSTFTGAGTIVVASTAGFPASGKLIVDTSAGALPEATGAVVSYSGTTASAFTGVALVSGAGTLSGKIQAVQPYHVTEVSCPGGNCAGNAVVSVTPPITTSLPAAGPVYSTGTCRYYVTATATATAPTAANGTSYYDGCMWENRNISILGNTFTVDPVQFNATPAPQGGSAWNCVTGTNCAQNAMGYQYPGGNAAPYNDVTLANAMMSGPTLPAPLDNLNAPGSPLATGTNGDVGPNGAVPYGNVWSGNTYVGAWTFQAYTQAADCPINWTGTSFQWVNYSGNACAGLSVGQWKTIWHQE
jgi:hypothetical protein